MPWRWRWRVAASQRSSTPTKAVGSIKGIHLSRMRKGTCLLVDWFDFGAITAIIGLSSKTFSPVFLTIFQVNPCCVIH